ncbi:hypothetical protein [Allosphingosinicella sp.]|uniref:hypothetical protein n=1 Tax=Allosphingosinicella sp. TaxID=2823234 RepID=UPI002F1862C7
MVVGNDANSIFKNHFEMGARLEFLATLLLFTGVSVAVIAALAAAIRVLSPAARMRIAVGVIALTAAAWLLLKLSDTPGIPEDIGLPGLCPTEGSVTGVCAAATYRHMLDLWEWWRGLLIIATACVVFGTICCLADADTSSSPDAEPPDTTAWVGVIKRQALRLNLFLYLAALLMVGALLVQFAFLRWPRFAVTDVAGFDAHVGAIIVYYGVGYSIFLASFYIPVALCLARRAEARQDEELRDVILKTTAIGPAGAVGAAASILAPTVAGLLTAWMDLA